MSSWLRSAYRRKRLLLRCAFVLLLLLLAYKQFAGLSYTSTQSAACQSGICKSTTTAHGLKGNKRHSTQQSTFHLDTSKVTGDPLEEIFHIDHSPKIVFWAKQYHNIDWKFTDMRNGDGGCEISFDRGDITEADAVIFFMKSCKADDLPPPEYRKQNQVYVWFSHESPWTTYNYYYYELTEYDNYFNWTMTYRTDSDVVAAMWPTPAMDYLLHRIGRTGEILDKLSIDNGKLGRNEYTKQVKALLRRKKNFVAWIASDCRLTRGASKRLKVVRSMEKTGLKISKFGNCVHKPIPYNFTVLFQVLSTYKFYLAFENSIHCKDYVTEKTLYNCFVSGSVPIINGPTREDTARILPAGSYIHVEDFESMQQLTDYLNYLNKYDSAYIQYFKWWMDPGAQMFPRFGFNYGPKYLRRNLSLPRYNDDDLQYDWLEYERFGLYHLCRKLKRGDHVKKTSVVSSLAKWWYGGQPSVCTRK